jgi:hypothetical protein
MLPGERASENAARLEANTPRFVATRCVSRWKGLGTQTKHRIRKVISAGLRNSWELAGRRNLLLNPILALINNYDLLNG